jgi:hypothetical protein
MSECDHEMTSQTLWGDSSEGGYEFKYDFCSICGSTQSEIDLKKERDELMAKLNEINCFHYNIKIGKYANMKRSKIIEQLGKLVFEKREVST